MVSVKELSMRWMKVKTRIFERRVRRSPRLWQCGTKTEAYGQCQDTKGLKAQVVKTRSSVLWDDCPPTLTSMTNFAFTWKNRIVWGRKAMKNLDGGAPHQTEGEMSTRVCSKCSDQHAPQHPTTVASCSLSFNECEPIDVSKAL
jgi:hypothetical protein